MSDDSSRHPPGELGLVQQLVNSVDFEGARDELASPDALAEWLREHELAEPGDTFGHEDLARALAFREALRALLLANNEGDLDPEALAVLNATARGAELVVALDDRGHARLEPGSGGIDRVFGHLLAVVAQAQAEGTWDRLKACPWHTCHWAFYDHSRNHSRTWCAMSVCGNRSKAQSYRRRQS